jgi:lipopolysaccharide transport system permease protein
MTATTTPTDEAPAPERAPRPLTVDLSGHKTSPFALLKELFAKRELFIMLARKEFFVRYRRASFGALWAVGLPLIQSAVMAAIFIRVAHFKGFTSGHQYAVFVLTGMTGFIFFSNCLSAGSTAIVDAADLSSKVYFPRAMLPLVQLGAGMYGLIISMVIVLIACPILGVAFSYHMFLIIPAILLLFALTAGMVLMLSALHVYFRDIRYLVGAALIVWMYVTPVIYPPEDAPHLLQTIIAVNPMSGIVDLFHTGTTGAHGPEALAIIVSLAWTVGLLTVGLTLQGRFNRVFSDLL